MTIYLTPRQMIPPLYLFLEITVPPSPPYSDEEDDWVIMTGSDFSARPASKRAIERLVKFEVKASHLPHKEEVAKESNEKDDDKDKGGDKDKKSKLIDSAEGAAIASVEKGGVIQANKIAAGKEEEKTTGKSTDSGDDSLVNGNKVTRKKNSKSVPPCCPASSAKDGHKVDSCTICLCSFELGEVATVCVHFLTVTAP